jgi:hypothetical protein
VTYWNVLDKITEIDPTTVTGGVAGDVIAEAIYVYWDLATDYNVADKLSFWFSADAPTSLLPDGTVIVSWLEYIATDLISDGNTDKIVCTTVVGSPESATVKNFFGSGSMKDADVAATAHTDVLSAEFEIDGEKAVRESDDWYYESYESELDANTVHSCEAYINITKIDRDYSFFTNYTATSGVRIYASATSTDPISIVQNENWTFTIDEPTYDESNQSEIWDRFFQPVIEYKEYRIDL